MSSHRTIAVRWMTPIKDTLEVNEAASPGHLVEYVTDRETVRKATTAGTNKGVRILLEDSLQGNSKTDAYSANDQAQVGTFRSGDRVQVMVGAGENIAIGDVLSTEGDGNAKELQSADDPMFIALEANDLSASAAVDTLTLVEVI